MPPRTRSRARRARPSAQAKSQLIADEPGSTRSLFNHTPSPPVPAHATPLAASSNQPEQISSSRPGVGEPTSPICQKKPESVTGTPIRQATSGITCPKTRSATTGSLVQTHQSETATPVAMTQNQLDVQIEWEMRNAIFHDPKFVDNFLVGDSTGGETDEADKADKATRTAEVAEVLARCRGSAAYDADNERWKLPDKIHREAMLYEPVLEILNAVKRRVEEVKLARCDSANDSLPKETHGIFSDDDPDNIPLEPDFQDRHSRATISDETDTAGLMPDIVLFDGHGSEHWENVRMPIEIKKLPGHQKAAMKQLSRYARAVFAHQVHRRHLFGLTICGTEATFVLFDRAGILYSPRIDMKKESDAFTRAFASLLLLDRTDEGYDTAFETELDENGRLKYYINLPACAFEDQTSPAPESSPSEYRTRKFEVIDKLCHRKSIRGRATIVLRLRPVGHPDADDRGGRETRARKRKREVAESKPLDGREYVLKIIWRDPARDSEGEIMSRFRGMFGLAQYVWHSDAPGHCHCTLPAERKYRCWAGRCVAKTAQLGRMEVCDNLRDIAISVPLGAEEYDLEQVDTTNYRSTSSARASRTCSYILMSSVGALLSEAESPREFMSAVLDAILGYWRLFNMGVLHRDISEGNVMMLERKKKLETKKAGKNKTILQQTQKPVDSWPTSLELDDPELGASEKALQGVLVRLNREPTGMLSDFDLHAKHTFFSLLSTTTDGIKDPDAAGPGPSVEATLAPGPPDSKRRTTNSRQSLPVSPTSRAKTSRASTTRPEQPSHARDERHAKIDFRTGTTAFMSVRVLKVGLGTPYHHSYLDDLESFFWVIYWSVAAHLDGDMRSASDGAQSVLNSMNQVDLRALASWKKGELCDCWEESGQEMRKTLESFKHSWASDPLVVNIIIRLGTYLRLPHSGGLPMDIGPKAVFPAIVDIIMEELGVEDPSSCHPVPPTIS